MFVQIVGNYLIESGHITAEQLKIIMEAQKTSKIKLGFLAVNEGYITEEKAKKINDMQKKEDMRFGDIAVKYGYMNPKQIETLLKKQGISHILFKQNIIDKGYMTLSTLNQSLESFQKTSGYTPKEFEAIQSDDITKISDSFLYVNESDPNYNDFKALSDFKNLISLILRYLIRFVSSDILIKKPLKPHTYNGTHIVLQGITGETPYHIALGSSGSPLALLELAGSFGKKDFKEANSDSMDSVGDFLNCVNGLFVNSLESESFDFNILPHEYHFDVKVQNKNMYVLPIYINGNQMDLLFSLGDTLLSI